MSESDPLSILRTYYLKHGNFANAEYEGSEVILDGRRLSESSPTAFKRGLNTAEDYYYTVKDVIFFMDNFSLNLDQYRQKVVLNKVKAVIQTDKDALKKYIDGTVDSCKQIQTDQVITKKSENISNVTHVSHEVTVKVISEDDIASNRKRHINLLDQMHLMTTTMFVTVDEITKRAKLEELSKTLLEEAETIDESFLDYDKSMLKKWRERESPARTRTSVLCKPGMDFRPKDKGSKEKKDSKVAPSNQASSSKPAKTNSYIIVVPNALTSPISLKNCEDLLLRGKYISSSDAVDKGQDAVRIEHGGLRFKIINDPRKLSSSEWDRVVAVFCTGQTWQFKDWKWPTPVELFKNVLGIHLNVDDQVVNPTVQSWNCKVIKIHPHKRHLDQTASNEFWLLCNEFIKHNK